MRAYSRDELKQLAEVGARERLRYHRDEIATILANFPTLQPRHRSEEPPASPPALPPAPDGNKLLPLPASERNLLLSLMVIAESSEPLTAAEIASRVATTDAMAPKAPTSYYGILKTAAADGLVKRDDERRYFLLRKGQNVIEQLQAKVQSEQKGGEA